MSMAVNSIRNNAIYNPSANSKNINKAAERLSSGKKVNSAADDAAVLAISEKLGALINGLNKGSDNSYDMKNLLSTAEGGFETISDSLLRIRELASQASNGIYNDSDKALLQEEVNQLISHIDSTAANTQFNNKNLLDGSFTDMNTASYADGTGMSVSIGSLSAQSLGIDGFDLTGDFDISAIDDALSKVTSARSVLGASMNRLDFTANYTENAAVIQAEAKSRMIDADMGKESINYNTGRILEQYRMFSIKNRMANAGNLVNMLL